MTAENTSFLRASGFSKGLSALCLKLIAIICMTADHFSVIFYGNGMTVWRYIGRIAFPLFAFMIARGAYYTRSIPKYMLRLGIFALISEIPFDIALIKGGVFDLSAQNVYFTLLIGLAAIWGFEELRKRKLLPLAIAVPILAAITAELARTDYGAVGVICIFLMYLGAMLPGLWHLAVDAVAILQLSLYISGMTVPIVNTNEICSLFALIPIAFYSGRQGKKINKYIFYGFYPAHILILWGIFTLLN